MFSRRHVWEDHRSANQWELVRGKSLHCTVMHAYTASIGSVKRANWCVCGARKRVLASRVVLAALREAPCADNIHRPRTQHASLEEIGVRNSLSLLTCQSDMGLDPPHERHSTACSNGAMSRRKSCVPASADLSPHVVRQCTFFARTQVVWTRPRRVDEALGDSHIASHMRPSGCHASLQQQCFLKMTYISNSKLS